MKQLFLISFLSLFLISCGITKRDYNVEPRISVQDDFLHEELAGGTVTNAEGIQKWWSNFNDPVLDTLIEKARKHNFDINTAIANFYASRAFVKGTKLDRFPTVTASGNYSRTRLGENVFVSGSNPTYNTFNAGFDAFWEADVFGRVSNRIKGALANSEVARAEMQGVYVRIFAEVATNYMELLGTRYLLDIARRNLKGQQDTYDLTLELSKAGTSNSLDVSRALAQLENTRATIPPLNARLEALKNSLSVLIGELPGKLDEELKDDQPLPSLPETVAMGDINQLLRRRPDVKRAEAALQVQIAQYNISVADLYPKIEFGGSIGFSAVDFSNFGQKESFTWSLIPRVSWAAFNLGRVKQQIRQNDALTIAAINQYEKVVLESLEELKTRITNYTEELQRRTILEKSSEASSQAAQFAKDRYNAGLDSFIDYLSADNTLLQSENALARSEIASVNSLIAIYKSLGGGWEIITEVELEKKYNDLKVTETNGD